MDILQLLKKMGAVPETKANEVMNPGATGYGAEFIPTEVFAKQIFDLVPQRARLLPLLPGNHGSNLPKKYVAPVVGLSVGDLLFQGKSDWSTGYAYQTQDDHGIKKAATMNVSLDQVPFICEVNISDAQLRYNAVNTEQYVIDQITKGMAYTIDSAIINGDSEAGSTGNVNSDDQAPATTFAAEGGALYHATMIDHGIRERAINGTYTVNAGTLDAADYSALLAKLGQYGERPEDCLFLQSILVSAKTRAIADFVDASKNGGAELIRKGILPTPYGVDILQHRAVPKTEADGKCAASAGSNTLGQVLAIYKPAIQYGFGADMNFEIVRVPGYGWRIVVTFDFAFSIVDSAASLANPTCAAAISVTIA
jgi:hypothetical protein